MQYILKGFTHDMGYRVFAFEAASEHGRTAYRVRTDLALARKHAIPVQELPLLCRAILERRSEGETERSYTYGEADMREYDDVRAARAAEIQKRHPVPRRPHGQKPGQTWRGPHVQFPAPR